jgi:hypothetical protein
MDDSNLVCLVVQGVKCAVELHARERKDRVNTIFDQRGNECLAAGHRLCGTRVHGVPVGVLTLPSFDGQSVLP